MYTPPPHLAQMEPTVKTNHAGRVITFGKSTTVSASPVRPGKTYPLSTLDHAMARHSVSLVFYYAANSGLDRESLKESLTQVLTHYPAMMGRMVWEGIEEGRWMVKCNDAGVRTVDARVEGVPLDQWLEGASAQEESELLYWEEMGKEVFLWSPFYIQITEFADRSVSIGLSCSHMHADPTCAALFVKAWGDTHRRTYIAHPPFFHPPGLNPRSEPNLETGSAQFLDHKSKLLKQRSSVIMSSATFRFSEAAVKSCLAQVADVCPEATPFDALASLFWLSIRRSTAASGGGGRTQALTLCVDFRKSMHAPLPHGFYGNALHFSKVEAGVLELGIDNWGHVAGVLNRHVAGLEEEEYWSAVDWFAARAKGSEAFQMYGPELTCLKLDHVFAYGAVFDQKDGGGRPVHVSCRLGGVEGEGVVVVMPAAEDGMARTVVVTLPAEVMDKVCKNDDILKHGPKVMFRG